ncbi:MAG TPA: VOC family protein [Propionicimonas sp.]|mgnify:CR=1 FL=1|jgi:catechol 2,3-dioxygenase-like lactoylglutathione lyase family enzyme|nr:VOC family protein [Propionicimonas sp.]
MLSGSVAIPTLAVSDLQRARGFYEGILGLVTEGDSPDGLLYQVGTGSILVYPSAYAGTNKATAVSFRVSEDDFDAVVGDLRGKGVSFQTFEFAGISWEDGVATTGSSRSVWFEDPDGNIINVQSGGGDN